MGNGAGQLRIENWPLAIGGRRGEGRGHGGHDGAEVLGTALPTVPMLAGADEYPLVGRRRPEAGQIQRRDVVDTLPGRRQQSQAHRMAQVGPTGTTGRGGEEPEVTLDPAMED
jgi:hypothetical protein